MNKEVKKVNMLFMLLICTFIFGSIGINLVWMISSSILGLTSVRYVNIVKEFLVYFPSILMVSFGGYYIVKNKLSLKNDLRFKSISPLVVLLLIIMPFVIMPFISFINAISMMFATNLVENTLDELTKNGLFYALFTVAVLPAFTEELIYRGVIGQTYIKTHWIKGVILSSFLFGIMHANFNQFSYAFVLGILFMLVLEATDSIYATIILHFIINGFNVSMAFLMKHTSKLLDGKLEKVLEENQEVTWSTVAQLAIPAIISLVGFCFLLVLIAKITGRYEILRSKIKGVEIQSTSLESDQNLNIEAVKIKLWSWHITLGTIICIIVAVLTEIQIRKLGG